ncbi:hypothetical protein [Massilia niabensis]|uniref:Uncharacterized protein n=1 Tax=Massilia niabensis TaxID=544910 RepID=A0ABW0LA37_9BURK
MNLNFLRRFAFGANPKRIEHPLFGTALLMETKSGPYWEIETVVWDRPFTVIIDTQGDEEPTLEQIDFYRRFTDDPDAAFAFASKLLIKEYEKWTGRSFPSHWKTAFAFVGLSIPLAGNPRNVWDLSFDCLTDSAGHQFTCCVENGEPSHVTVDG